MQPTHSHSPPSRPPWDPSSDASPPQPYPNTSTRLRAPLPAPGVRPPPGRFTTPLSPHSLEVLPRGSPAAPGTPASQLASSPLCCSSPKPPSTFLHSNRCLLGSCLPCRSLRTVTFSPHSAGWASCFLMGPFYTSLFPTTLERKGSGNQITQDL